MGVGAGANEEQENEKKGLKIEYCGLFVSADKCVSIFVFLLNCLSIERSGCLGNYLTISAVWTCGKKAAALLTL